MTLTLLILCLLGLTGYILVTGFHDASNGVAVAVRTRALTPRTALLISASLNFLGMLISAIVLNQFVVQWLSLPPNNVGLAMLLTALIAQISWGLFTFWQRVPSSSAHALLGGIAGSLWAARATDFPVANPFTEPIFTLFLIPLIAVPIVTFLISWTQVFPYSRLVSLTYPRTVNKISRNSMSVANSIISLIHGVQIGQRAVVMFAVICLAGGITASPWVTGLAMTVGALVLAVGTLMGGWRIGHTFAYKMVRLDPLRGAIAQGTTATVLTLSQLFLNTPVSSSHLAASAVLGAGVNQRFSALRPGIVAKLLITWFSTMPVTFCLSAVLFLALSPLLGG